MLTFWGFTERSDFQGGSQKTNIEGGLFKKRGLGQFANLGGLGKKEAVVFLSGVDTPMHTMNREHHWGSWAHPKILGPP